MTLVSVLSCLAPLGCQRQLPPDRPPDLARAEQLRTSFTSVASSAAPTTAASSQQPTGWATLRGRIALDGQAPARQALSVNKDTEVCAPGGKQVLSETVVVAEDGGIKDVVIFLESEIPDDDPWTHESARPGKTGMIDFDQKDCVFLTHVLAMQTTQTLNILNSDPVGHNTNMSPDRNSAFNSTIPVGGRAVYQPRAEERQPFPTTCSIHPWMQAWIIARDNSYVAVTGPDGSFEIPNLPAGVDLEFRIWQEKSRFVPAATVNGKAQKLSKGKLVWRLSPTDQAQNQWDLQLDAALFR